MEANLESAWKAAREVLRTMLNPDIYKLWFANLQAVSLTAEEAALEVPNDFCQVWLTDNYLSLLQDVLTHATGRPIRVRFQVAAPLPDAAVEPQKTPAGSLTPQRPAGVAGEVQTALKEPSFNPNNTFETFVVGSNNSFAHAAALAVAQHPGKSYNPLFVYGGVGLGKTHLLHAIGQYMVQHKRGARVAYLSSEKFTNEFIDGLQTNQLAKFRRKYRQMDMLLIDDVQFLANKERIQEEFFHTFNALHDAHRQIVMTCDRPIGEIQNLEHRLVTRFEWGLVTDLQPPDVETREAILKKKEKALGVELPQEVITFLATRIRSNVRRLEGALIRVASYSSLTGKPLNLDLVESLLREVLHEEGRFTITIQLIQKRVAEHFDIRLADMTSKRRPENIAFPRQIAMFLARNLTESSLSSIGEAFGGRDHGTVMHACRLVKDRMEVDASVRQVVSYLERQLQR